MQVSIETMTGLERRLTIGVPAERVDQEVNKRLQKVASSARLDGFRPGKVPMKVLQQRFGSGVRQEVIGEVISQTFYEAVVKEALQPAGQPTIEPREMAPGKDLKYVATFEVYPEVVLQDLSGIVVDKLVAEVTEADIDKMIETFRKQQASFDVVERPAAAGDQVNIDYEGLRDGEPFAGGSASGTDLQLGSGRMIPGFEAGIEGMQAGDEKTLALTFPEDYHNEALKGAAVEFKIKVNSVAASRLPELNEEFFARYGVSSGGLEAFRSEIAGNMQRELNKAVTGKLKEQVMDQLVKIHDVPLPAALVASEVEALRNQMVQQFGQAAGQFDASFLPDDLFRDQAVRRVELGLILGELIRRDKLEADTDKVRAKVEELAAAYQDPEEVVNYYYGNKELLNSVRSAVLEDAAVSKVLAAARVTEVPVSYEQALAPSVPAQDAGADEAAAPGE